MSTARLLRASAPRLSLPSYSGIRLRPLARLSAAAAPARAYSATVSPILPTPGTNKDVLLSPPEWAARPKTERFEISPFGYTMPRIYVPMCEVFPLAPSADREAIVKSLTQGLEATIAHVPAIAGTLDHDEKNGCMVVVTDKDRPLKLHVRDATTTMASFSEMEANDFPCQAFPPELLTPQETWGRPYWNAVAGERLKQQAAGFQVTFIDGGIIISLSMHHFLTDATGMDALFGEWAAHTKAILQTGQTAAPSPVQYKVSGTSYEVPKPTSHKIVQLAEKHYDIVNHETWMPPPAVDLPEFKPQMWHFSKSGMSALKKKLSKMLKKGEWVSTYDVILATLWSSIVRARAPDLHKLAPMDRDPVLTHAINTRGGLMPPMTNDHVACGTTITRVEAPLTLEDLRKPLSLEQLARLALDIRHSIRETRNCSWLYSEMQHVEGQRDKRFVATDVQHLRGMDLCVSSWREMKAYHMHDFGFGLPHALRLPYLQTEGYVFMQPSRAHLKASNSDEGTEMVVFLDKASQQRLMKDEELLKYAEPRGKDFPLKKSVGILEGAIMAKKDNQASVSV